MVIENFSKRLQLAIALKGFTPPMLAKKSICNASFINEFLVGGKETVSPNILQRISRALGVRPYFFTREYQDMAARFSTIEEQYIYESWNEIMAMGADIPHYEVCEGDHFLILLEEVTRLWQEGKIKKEQMLDLTGLYWSDYKRKAHKILKNKVA